MADALQRLLTHPGAVIAHILRQAAGTSPSSRHLAPMDKETYAILFPKLNPSQVTKLALADQLKENRRIQKELAALPAEHDLRKQYEAGLLAEIDALEKADVAVNEADVALALARSKMRQSKLQLDKDRLGIHAALVGILADKKAADGFFRPASTGPGGKGAGASEEGGTAEETPA